MALLSLIARLGLDDSSFQTQIKSAETTAEKFGKKFQGSIAGSIGRFFSLGFAIGLVQDKIRALEGTGETLSIPTGTLSDEIEAQEELIRGTERRLGIKKEVQKLDDEIFKTADQRFLKELSDEDRREELTRRRIALLQILRDFDKMPPVKRKEMQLETEKLLNQIISIDQDAKEKAEQPKFRTRTIGDAPRDPLARIGGFTGGADVKVLTVQERIAKATEETATNTAANTVAFR